MSYEAGVTFIPEFLRNVKVGLGNCELDQGQWS
jgi:hypothetical protein